MAESTDSQNFNAWHYKDNRRDFVVYWGPGVTVPDWVDEVKKLNMPEGIITVRYIPGGKAVFPLCLNNTKMADTWYGPFFSLEEAVSFLAEIHSGNELIKFKYELNTRLFTRLK